MRWAPSLQSLKVQRIFLGGMPPRRGRDIVRWEEGGRRLDMGVGEVGGRCLPMWERRIEEGGAEVRRERRWWRVGRVVSEGMVRGIAGGC